jgi:hypothetical protein
VVPNRHKNDIGMWREFEMVRNVNKITINIGKTAIILN